MAKMFNVHRKTIVFACGLVLLLSAVALALSVRTKGQRPQALNQTGKNEALEQVERLADQPMRIVGNDDSPLRITKAMVKEVSGSQFAKLTGKTTDLATVSSVPETELVNNSGKTIKGFVLAIRDPKSKTTRGVVQQKVSVAPGETYIIKREQFLRAEKMSIAGENGQVRQTLVQPKMDSEKYWLPFAGRPDMFITVGQVSFDDGSSWTIKEGGEVR